MAQVVNDLPGNSKECSDHWQWDGGKWVNPDEFELSYRAVSAQQSTGPRQSTGVKRPPGTYLCCDW